MEERGVCENEVGDGMQCIKHPHRNNLAGMCAYCLQDKLHNLLSSSFPLPIPPPPSSSSTSSSPSFTAPPLPPPSLSVKKNNVTSSDLDPKKKNKKHSTNSSSALPPDIIFKRSKSTATPRNRFLNDEDFSPRKRHGFWSFLYPSSSKPSASSSSCSNKVESRSFSPRISTAKKAIGKKSEEEDENSPNSDASGSSYERKVSRSRSVGCGSRSFSGDLFDRISSGLGDCTLRRVESQREHNNNKPKVNHCMKQRVRCEGSASSTSTSSSSSSYWLSSSADDRRGRSWGWAFATPIRAFAAKTF